MIAERGILTLLLGFVANDLVIFRKICREFALEPRPLLRPQLSPLVPEIGDVRPQLIDLVPDAIGDLLVVLGGLFRGWDDLWRRLRWLWCRSQRRPIRARVGSVLDDDRSCLGWREDLDRDLGSFGLERDVVGDVEVARAFLPTDVGQLGGDEGAFAAAAAWAHRDVVPGGGSSLEAAASPSSRRAERDGCH